MLVGTYRDAASEMADDEIHLCVFLGGLGMLGRVIPGKPAADGALIERMPGGDAGHDG